MCAPNRRGHPADRHPRSDGRVADGDERHANDQRCRRPGDPPLRFDERRLALVRRRDRRTLVSASGRVDRRRFGLLLALLRSRLLLVRHAPDHRPRGGGDRPPRRAASRENSLRPAFGPLHAEDESCIQQGRCTSASAKPSVTSGSARPSKRVPRPLAPSVVPAVPAPTAAPARTRSPA